MTLFLRIFTSVQYTRISDAIAGIAQFKQPCYLSKTDISMAYRNLPLRPDEYHLFGFKWKDVLYYDKCLPMGCSSSCQIFERFSTSLHWIGEKYMSEGKMFHILDDFLIVSVSRIRQAILTNIFTNMRGNRHSDGPGQNIRPSYLWHSDGPGQNNRPSYLFNFLGNRVRHSTTRGSIAKRQNRKVLIYDK